MASQLMLFETDTAQQPDGSLVVRPRRLVDGREITARRAAAMLSFKDPETIYRMVETKQLRGWKPKTARGNGKYRIDLGSVLEYKQRQAKAG